MSTPMVTFQAPAGNVSANIIVGATSYPIVNGLVTVPSYLTLALMSAGFLPATSGARLLAAFQ